MKKIITMVIIAAMMTGCGKVADLMQPRIVEVEKVIIKEIPADTSNFVSKKQYYGSLAIVGVGALITIGYTALKAYNWAIDEIDEAEARHFNNGTSLQLRKDKKVLADAKVNFNLKDQIHHNKQNEYDNQM
jgi:hypothetical protein